ncbi:riboflavin synthase subunit alpha [Sodalis-like secondary symbiont of Drepanosiphum platanoidis]|uniref:riboflavin synthase subunit alpha n=1 Tax=Sodalis-like secondary symbiont of Drepanosiphum platanoidis TaxID=2994493 RepID=UPI003463ED0A
MFTGIIQSTSKIISIKNKKNFSSYEINIKKFLLKKLSIGASISNNGCCLTVTNIKDKIISFDLTKETLTLTNLGLLKIGDFVNIERSAKIGEEIGGHLLSGHIICTAIINKILNKNNNYIIWFNISQKNICKYIYYKGYISIDGISLTINNIKKSLFSVCLIPETLRTTTLGKKKCGDKVNIEIDLQTQIIVDTVEKFILLKKNT